MRYQKPVVMNMGSRTSSAACIGGSAATGGGESCGDGIGAGWSCVDGTGDSGGNPLCAEGNSASAEGDCFTGNSVQFYCGAGTDGFADPLGCRTGSQV